MKLKAFMNMANKLESMKPKYESCICSPSTYGTITKFAPREKLCYGLKIFQENYFPDDSIWLLDKDYTKIYMEKGLAGLIAHIADIDLTPILDKKMGNNRVA